MADARAPSPAAAAVSLPAELESRLAAVEAAGATDFDAVGWFWMLLLGLAGPIALIALGWWLGPAAG